MKIQNKNNNHVIVKSIWVIRNTRQALYAAAALHTVAPLLLLACLVIPLVISARG